MKLNHSFDGLLYGEMFGFFLRNKQKKIPTIGQTAQEFYWGLNLEIHFQKSLWKTRLVSSLVLQKLSHGPQWKCSLAGIRDYMI